MAYEIRFSPKAITELNRLPRCHRTTIVSQIRRILAVNPTLESKARVKQLQSPAPSGYRLRVGEFRVFYTVVEYVVYIVSVLSKDEAVQFAREGQDGDSEDNPAE
jgi:mRNA-degrading endonuclease RelE of RelBE toxin-antitoxin system